MSLIRLTDGVFYSESGNGKAVIVIIRTKKGKKAVNFEITSNNQKKCRGVWLRKGDHTRLTSEEEIMLDKVLPKANLALDKFRKY